MRGEHELKQRLLAKPHQCFEVQLQQCLEWLALLHCRILLGEFPDACDEKENLHLQRLLAPERSVVVEHRNALCRGYEVGTALTRHAPNKVEDLRFRRTVVPAGE